MQRSAGQVGSAQHGSFITDWSESMKLFNDLLEAHGYKVVQTRDGLSARSA